MELVPDDAIQEDILMRLPLRSLVACIFVCKKWNTMICNNSFKTRYLQRSTTRHMDPTPESLFHSIYLHPHQHTVSAPIRGWILVKSSASDHELSLYNPITDEIFNLPVHDFEEIGEESDAIFGYDEANGVFKVLVFFSRAFGFVYTVKPSGEGSWRNIAFEPPHHMSISPLIRDSLGSYPPLTVTNALCKGGVLYYIAMFEGTPTIMSFDLNSEEFAVIPSPERFIVDSGSTIVNYNGKVAVVNNSVMELQVTGEFEIFVRDEDSSGQWELETIEIPGWREETVWSGFMFSFVGTIGAADGVLVFAAPTAMLEESEYVLYYTPGEEKITRPVTLDGANKDAYHYVRACLNHFYPLLRAN